MNLADYTPERISEDITKLRYFFKLKEVTRYNTPREMEDDTESVAEHLYGMQLLAQYFLPLEDSEETLDRARVYELITVHDFDEIETGDYLSFIKDESHKSESEAAIPKVLAQIPTHLRESLSQRINEYETQATPESRFVKAIDKIEPLIQVYTEKGKIICHRNKCTAEDSLRIKAKYIEPFPFIKTFALTLHQTLIDGGYYWSEGE